MARAALDHMARATLDRVGASHWFGGGEPPQTRAGPRVAGAVDHVARRRGPSPWFGVARATLGRSTWATQSISKLNCYLLRE